MRQWVWALAAVSLGVELGRPAWACTAFAQGQGDARVVAKSYDWNQGEGHLITNKRGVAKQALLFDGSAPARWVSRYASVTFNQYGREMPNGGMNEAGLVIEILWLDTSVYPPRDTRPTTNELQWIQFELDQAANVPELIAHAKEVRVAPAYAKVHYFACDAATCATIEFIGGQLVVHTGAELPVPAITNDTYEASRRYEAQHPKGAEGAGSLERFSRVAATLTQPEKASGDAVARAFALLDRVHNRGTQWNIVYEPARKRVSFRTRAHAAIQTYDLSAELSAGGACTAPVRYVDIEAPGPLADWTATANRKLLEQSLQGLAGRIPSGAIEGLAAYPTRLPCAGATKGAP
jgi:choloylglycine hydrolase